MKYPRLLGLNTHNDGVDMWFMARLAPADNLQPEIRAYVDYTERIRTFTCRRELPHPEGVLIFNLGEDISITGGDRRQIGLRSGQAFLAGVHLRPALSHSQGAQSGVQVELPLSALRRLFGVPMNRLVDQVLPLEELLGAEAHSLGQRLCDAPGVEARIAVLDAAFIRRLTAAAPLDRRVTGAIHLLRHRFDLDIAEIGFQVGWSRKHLADRIQDAVGVGPRTFRRLLRFQRLTGELTKGPVRDWTAAALEAGYCDQSHLIREFREFAGLKPSEFASRMLSHGGGLMEH